MKHIPNCGRTNGLYAQDYKVYAAFQFEGSVHLPIWFLKMQAEKWSTRPLRWSWAVDCPDNVLELPPTSEQNRKQTVFYTDWVVYDKLFHKLHACETEVFLKDYVLWQLNTEMTDKWVDGGTP